MAQLLPPDCAHSALLQSLRVLAWPLAFVWTLVCFEFLAKILSVSGGSDVSQHRVEVSFWTAQALAGLSTLSLAPYLGIFAYLFFPPLPSF